MTVGLSQPLRLQQRDGEVLILGPIPDRAVTNPPPYYDATSHSCRLVIKTNVSASDASGTTIIGSLSGNTTAGFFASFTIPDAITATATTYWAHAWVTPSGGKPRTIRNSPLIVEAT